MPEPAVKYIEFRNPDFWKDTDPLDMQIAYDLISLSGAGEENKKLLSVILREMFLSRSKGNLCLRLNGSVTGTDFDPRSLPEMFPGIIEEKKGESVPVSPLVLLKHNKDYLLYFHKYIAAAESLRRVISEFSSFSVQKSSNPALVNAVPSEKKKTVSDHSLSEEDILDHIINKEPVLLSSGKPLVPAEKQREAVIQSLRSDFLIITGGPGTGKTATVQLILRAALYSGIRKDEILLAAPTGRAAKRITEVLSSDEKLGDMRASTIHRLLEYSPARGGFQRNRNNPLHAKLIIADETSMVDAVLMTAFMEAVIPGKTKVILIGDPDQLPSVDAGAVLADLIRKVNPEQSGIRHVRLDRGHRSAGNISRLAASVLSENPDMNLFHELKESEISEDIFQSEDKVYFAESDSFSSPATRTLLLEWIRSLYTDDILNIINKIYNESKAADPEDFEEDFKKLMELTNTGRILSIARKDKGGMHDINKYCSHILAEMNRENGIKGPSVRAGTPVMIERNDYDNDLFNGDTGILIPWENSLRVLFPGPEGPRLFSPSVVQGLTEAFAVTVHKSQGSEFKRVLLVLPDEKDHPLLSKELIYTAITRTKHLFLITGRKEEFIKGSCRHTDRETGAGPI